jgi:AcrR family transcriptional regulator
MPQVSRSEPQASEVHKGGPVQTSGRGRKEETQDRIVAAALALFATRGYERASISSIAAHARVSRGAIFWHFGDKEGLFRETFRRMLVPFFTELQASLEHIPPRQRVFEILSAYERVVDENETSIRSIVRWLLESEKLRASLRDTLFALHDALVKDISDTLAAARGEAQPSDAVGAALVAMLDGNLLLALLDPNARNRELRRAGLRRLVELAIGSDGE